MVATMGVTAFHMRMAAHGLDRISLVYAGHTLGMFAFSPLWGSLADRRGRAATIVLGSGLMMTSLALAPLSSQSLVLAAALFLLGLGWNACFVAGSTMLSDQLTSAERSRTQGFNDLLVGLTAGLGSLGGGLLFAQLGYGALSITGLVIMSVALTLGAWSHLSHMRLAPESVAA
jgi:MFS family permease